MQPYVVTLALDDAVQARLDAERERWFPAGRTQVGAHVTLFHAVPGDLDVAPALQQAVDRPAFEVRVSEVMPLGRGAAYRLVSAELAAVHGALQAAWRTSLTRQDAQGFRPHVTVQNKVTPQEARETLAVLERGFEPFDVPAVGLDLWRYEDGPWSHVERYAFG